MQRQIETSIWGIKRFFSFWNYALNIADCAPIEGLRSVLLIFSALVVLDPNTSIYGTSATYKYIQWLPESLFGAILLFIALNALVAVVSGNLRYRMFTTFAMFIVWSVLFIFFFSANPHGMLIPWTGIFGLTSLVNWLRVLEDYRNERKVPWTHS